MNTTSNAQTAGDSNTNFSENNSLNLNHQTVHSMNTTSQMPDILSNTLPTGMVACLNCNAHFNPNNSPNCPSCGLHYKEMICMHCGENFQIPQSQLKQWNVQCPHCGDSSYRPFLEGVTAYPLDLQTFFFDIELEDLHSGFDTTTYYDAVTDYPFDEIGSQYYPHIIQYDPSTVETEKHIPSTLKEYAIPISLLDNLDINHRLHIRGIKFLCNTTNTPAGTRLHVQLRDRQSYLQLEDTITPAKGQKVTCKFDFGADRKEFSKDICMSLHWEKDGAPLNQDIILWSAAKSDISPWKDKLGNDFVPALNLHGYTFNKITQEIVLLTPSSDYPSSDYPSSDYPSSDYPTTLYPSQEITVPNSLLFTLMDEEKNLWYQMGNQGEVTGSYKDEVLFTFFPEEQWMCLERIDLGLPSRQFDYSPDMDVRIYLNNNNTPISVYASWDTENMLSINLLKHGIPEEKRTIPFSQIRVKVSSQNQVFYFSNSVNNNPIAAIFGHRCTPLTTSIEETKLHASVLSAITDPTSTVPVPSTAHIENTSLPENLEINSEFFSENRSVTFYDTPNTNNNTEQPEKDTYNGWAPTTCYCCSDDENDNEDEGDNYVGEGQGNNDKSMGNNPMNTPGLSTGHGSFPKEAGLGQGIITTGNSQNLKTILGSPDSIYYRHPTEKRIVCIIPPPKGNIETSTGIILVSPSGYPRIYTIPPDSTKATPADRTQNKPEQLEKITITQPDGSGLAPQTSWYEETMEDGTVLRYSTETGTVAALKSPKGDWSTPQDWEQNVRLIYENKDTPSGLVPPPSIGTDIKSADFKRPGTLRQIWSKKEGLMDITTQSSTEYTIDWYATADVGEYNTQTKRYTILPGKTSIKKWIIQAKPIDYTTTANGKKYEVGTNRELTEYDLELLKSLTVTEIRDGERFVTHWEQPDSQTLIYTKGEDPDMETVVTKRIATDPDTLENLRKEYDAMDGAYLRVGNQFTREIEETRTIPTVPGGTRVRYRRYPFGDVCTLKEKGTGTSMTQLVTYEYDLNTASPSYGCRIRENHSNGKVVEMAYDAKKRLISRKEPCARGAFKITRFAYSLQPQHLHRLASVTEAITGSKPTASGEFRERPISRKQYAYSETPALKEEIITHTALAWKDLERTIPATPQISVTQWYGSDPQSNGSPCARAVNRIKMTRDAAGRELQYRYRNSSEYGIPYTCTVTETIQGMNVPGQSTQTVFYYDVNDQEVRREEFVHTGQGWTFIGQESYTRDEMNRIIRTNKPNGKHTSTLWMCGGPLQETDEDGVSTYYRYNSAKRLVGVTREMPSFATKTTSAGVPNRPLPFTVSEYFYDGAGRKTEERTTMGQTVTSRKIQWDALSRPTSETDESGAVTLHSYSSDGLTTTTTLPTGATLITLRHTDGQIIKETGSGQLNLYYYHTLHNESLVTSVGINDFNGPTVRQTYTDGYGRVIAYLEPRGKTMITRHTLYDDKDNAIAERAGHLPGIRTDYDSFGQAIKITQQALNSSQESQIIETCRSYVVKAMNPGFLSTDTPEWFNTPLVWKETIQKSSLDKSNGNRTSKHWELVSKTLPNTRHVSLTQNQQGIQSADWTENTKGNIFQYNAIQGTAKRGSTITLGGRMFKQTAISGDFTVMEYQYLADGLNLSATDSRNNKQITQYDKSGRVKKQIDAMNNSTLYEYNAVTGLLTGITHPDGKTTRYDYDRRGRTVSVYGTAEQPVRYDYDEADRMTALYTWRVPGLTMSTSPMQRTDGDITTWNYSTASGALLSKQTADGYYTSYTYTEKGLLQEKREPDEKVTYYGYDPRTEQPLSIDFSDGAPGTVYTRNGWGEIISISDASGTRTLSYSQGGVLLEEKTTGMYASVLTRRHHDAGLPQGYLLTLNGIPCQEIRCDYGDDLRISRVHTLGNQEYTYKWKSNSPLLEKLTFPNGTVREYGYDTKHNLLTDINYRNKSGSTIYSHALGYDQTGRLVSRSSGPNAARRHEYAYNDRGEVTGHTLGSEQWTYAYDNIGNRSQNTLNTSTRNYTTNAVNQYTNITASGPMGTETVKPIYDSRGNQTQVNTASGNWTVTWNAENRPVSFVRGDKRVECIYDHMGRRVQKIVLLKDTPVSCRRYVYNGYQLVGELDALHKHAAPELVKSWTWDPTRSADATPLEVAFWEDEEDVTQYPEEDFPSTDFPDSEFPEGRFFTSTNLYWNEPRENLCLYYLKNGRFNLDVKDRLAEGSDIRIDSIALAVDGTDPLWQQYSGRYKVEIGINSNPMTVYAELDEDTLKIDLSSYLTEKRLLSHTGQIHICVQGSPQNASLETWSPLPTLPCYHDTAGKPLAHVSGFRIKCSHELGTTNYPLDTTDYPEPSYPNTDFPEPEVIATKYPDWVFPENHFFTSSDLYRNEPQEGISLIEKANGRISLNLKHLLSDEHDVYIDYIQLAVDGSYPVWHQYTDPCRVAVQLDAYPMSVYAELDQDTLKIDIPGSYGNKSRKLSSQGDVNLIIQLGSGSIDSAKDTLPFYHDSKGKPLVLISGQLVNKSTNRSMGTFTSTNHSFSVNTTTLFTETGLSRQSLCEDVFVNEPALGKNTPTLPCLDNRAIQLASIDGNAPYTRYDDEFNLTVYPEEPNLPEQFPTFYSNTPETLWCRDNREKGVCEVGDTLHIDLDGEFPIDSKVVVDSFEIIAYDLNSSTALTMELYFNDKRILNVTNSPYGLFNFDLKNKGVSEQDRTLSGHKSITVKFKKDGVPYTDMGIYCTVPGKPAGLIKGSLTHVPGKSPRSISTCLTDHNKNVTGLANEQGTITTTWDYDAFGNIIQQTGTQASRNPLRFSSEYHDEDLGLIYYNYRHYNPKDGRWISRDPIDEKGTVNLYSFIRNYSLSVFDLLGKVPSSVDPSDLLGWTATGPGILEDASTTIGFTDSSLILALDKAIQKAELIKDEWGHQCYSIVVKTTPLTPNGIKALPGLADKAILLAHSSKCGGGGFQVKTCGTTINSMDINKNVTCHGCHEKESWQSRLSFKEIYDLVIKDLEKLKPKKCCLHIEIILIATGTINGSGSGATPTTR